MPYVSKILAIYLWPVTSKSKVISIHRGHSTSQTLTANLFVLSPRTAGGLVLHSHHTAPRTWRVPAAHSSRRGTHTLDAPQVLRYLQNKQLLPFDCCIYHYLMINWLCFLKQWNINIWQRSIYSAWMSNYIYVKQQDGITHPCPKFKYGLVKPRVKLGRGWVIKSHIR